MGAPCWLTRVTTFSKWKGRTHVHLSYPTAAWPEQSQEKPMGVRADVGYHCRLRASCLSALPMGAPYQPHCHDTATAACPAAVGGTITLTTPAAARQASGALPWQQSLHRDPMEMAASQGTPSPQWTAHICPQPIHKSGGEGHLQPPMIPSPGLRAAAGSQPTNQPLDKLPVALSHPISGPTDMYSHPGTSYPQTNTLMPQPAPP